VETTRKTEKTMSQLNFNIKLRVALLADYFNLSYLLGNPRAEKNTIMLSWRVACEYDYLLKDLGVNFEFFETNMESYDGSYKYFYLNFASVKDKEIVEEFFISYNTSTRMQDLITFVDVFQGSEKILERLAKFYLALIDKFFIEYPNGSIAMPIGISEMDNSMREFMVYNSNGMVGSYKGSDLFNDERIYRVE
jgi:hypothetical protein